MADKPKVYIETSVVSYLVAHPSKSLVVAGRQVITHDWWANELPKFEGYVSSYVMAEAKEGDPDMAKAREEKLSKFTYLEDSDEIAKIARRYLAFTGLPDKCLLDCEHMATASFYNLDFLVSWNCKHIVNGIITKKIKKANDSMDLPTPMICTPETLFEESNDN